jgi:tetratricopeptide (TPR) repeat protein
MGGFVRALERVLGLLLLAAVTGTALWYFTLPWRAEEHFRQARLHQKRGELDTAVERYQEGLRLNPAAGAERLELAGLYYHRHVAPLVQRRLRSAPDQELRVFEGDKGLSAESVFLSLASPWGKAVIRQLDLAERFLRSPTLYEIRGKCRSFEGDFEGAQADLQYARRLDPRRAGLNRYLAWVYLEQGERLYRRGDVAAARRLLDKALAADAREPRAHTALGYLAWREGDTEGAARHFQQACTVRPLAVGARYGLARILWYEGRKDEAGRHLWKLALTINLMETQAAQLAGDLAEGILAEQPLPSAARAALLLARSFGGVERQGQVLRQIRPHLADDPEVLYAQATDHLARLETEECLRTLELLLEQAPRHRRGLELGGQVLLRLDEETAGERLADIQQRLAEVTPQVRLREGLLVVLREQP